MSAIWRVSAAGKRERVHREGTNKTRLVAGPHPMGSGRYYLFFFFSVPMARMDPPSSSSSERWPGWGDDEKKHSITDTIDIEKGENGEELDARKERIRDCMTVLGGFLSIMATGGAINSVGLLQTHWENNQLREYSPQTVGWIAGTNLFLSLFVPVLAGPVFDRYGHVWILAVGSSLFVVGLFIISFFDDHSPAPVTLGMMISSWGVLCGTGYGLIQTAVPGLICRRFDRRRGLANGFSSLGNSVGGVLWPMLLRVALERLGWSWSMRAIDGLALVMLAIGNVLVWGSGVPVVGTAAKPEPESSDNEKNREEQVEEGKKPSLTWGQCIRNGARCFRKGDFVWMTASLAIFQFVVMGVAGTLPSWGQQQGFKDASLFFYVVAVVNA